MSENIKYRQLKAFCTLVETGTFRAAADRMGITQPSLSTVIKELERDIDVVLFDRSTRKSRLTEEGRNFYAQIKSSLEQLEDAYRGIKDVGRGERGRLRLGALSSLAAGIIATRLGQFHQRYPGVQITLCERTHDNLLEAVRHGEVDLGVGMVLRSDPDLAFTPVFKDRLMIVAPAGHPLAKKRRVWSNLAQYELVMVRPGPSTHALRLSQVRLPTVEVEQTATALAMVRNGMGVTVVPSSIVEGMDTEGLECLPMQGPMAMRSLGIIQKRHAQLSATARAFVQILTA